MGWQLRPRLATQRARAKRSDPARSWPGLAADWLEGARRPTHNLLPTRNEERGASKRCARRFNARRLKRSQIKWSAGFLLRVPKRRSIIRKGSVNAIAIKYEDNFGFYCIDDDDPEELEFFCHIIAQSEPTICARCNQKVGLLEHIKICATCSQALEYGAPSDPAWVVPIFGQ
jgi:hypothetical protein